MFRFNMSEEVIFSIKNGDINNRIFNSFNCDFLNELINENVLIFFGFDNFIRDELLREIIVRIFEDKYFKFEEPEVFRISNAFEIEEIYNKNKFQIFYLRDFFGEIKESELKKYCELFKNSKNKFLIVNSREFFCKNFEKIHFVNLEMYKHDIINFLIEKFNFGKHENSFGENNFKIDLMNDFSLENFYSQLVFMDKFILMSILIGSFQDVHTWIQIVTKYFSNKIQFSGSVDFKDIIFDSLRKLEDVFIFLDFDGNLRMKNLIIEDFLISKIVEELEIFKDVLNNVCLFEGLKESIKILKGLNISLNYTKEYYEENFKARLTEVVNSNLFFNAVEVLECLLNVFSLIGFYDESIIYDLNSKIIYLNFREIDYAKYFLCMGNFKNYLIKDEGFIKNIVDLIYKNYTVREFEFYNYSFEYFLFVSEFNNCYKNIYEDEFEDVINHFNRLVYMILNYVNSYFTFEYFTLNNEIKVALHDLKVLVEDLKIKFIFSSRVDEIFYNSRDKLIDLINFVVNLVPNNKQEYYSLISFQNELEVNGDFIENTFCDISIDEVLNNISSNICSFSS